MDTNRRSGSLAGWGKRFAAAAAVLLILGPAIYSLSQTGGQEDPLLVIQKRGTAGMRLQGGQTIEVRGDKIYVRSGQTVRPLFEDKAQFFVGANTSKLPTADIRRLALEAVQAKLSGPFSRSYKVRSSFELKSESGGRRTILARFVFEYKNIWYAEEHALELDIASEGGAHKLAASKPVAVPAAGAVRPIGGKIAARPAASAQRAGGGKAAKAGGYKLEMATTAKFVAAHGNFANVSVADLAKSLGPLVTVMAPKGLANTAYPEVVTAAEATNQVQIIMQAALGTARKLVGPAESSKARILDYLKTDTNLVAWNNIGHGNTATLFQNGTEIGAADFAPFGDFRGLSGCVCLVNSCQTFNDPLKAAILACAPRVYIAGVINLPMVTSEGSNPNFWWKTLFEHKPMSVAYAETNNESGLNGYWGFWGDAAAF